MDTVGKTVFSKASSPSPVEKTGMMVKLGWNKTVLGADSWQLRYFRLTATGLSYAKGPDAPIIDNIVLHKTVDCNLVEAGTAARRNRYENNDAGNSRANLVTSGPVGKDNCVEMIVPYESGKVDLSASIQERVKQMRGRTYYFHCASKQEAKEWMAAILNNVKALPAARIQASSATESLGYEVTEDMSVEEFQAAYARMYAEFSTEVAARTIRSLLRVKKLELTSEQQAGIRQQVENELKCLQGTTRLAPAERKVTVCAELTGAIAEEAALTLDEEKKLPEGTVLKVAKALFKVYQEEELLLLQAQAQAMISPAVAQLQAARAARAAMAAAAAEQGEEDSSLAGDLAGAAGDAVGGHVADAAIDVLTGLIPLPLAGAVIGAGIKHIVKKTAVAAATKK